MAILDWVFNTIRQTEGGRGNVQERLVLEGSRTISAFGVFVREVLQNALDAAAKDENGDRMPVHIHFRFRLLETQSEKSAFRNGFGWKELKRHIRGCQKIKENSQHPVIYNLEEINDKPLMVLEICETNTIGLIGPESIANFREDITGDNPKAFFALVRDDERHEKQRLGAGGTHGKGKAVIWAVSAIQTALFYSRLSIPFENDVEKILHRAAGQSRLHQHYVQDDERFSGVGHGGRRDADNDCWAIRNDEAIQWAKQMGIDAREDNGCGTTILIPYWERPATETDFSGEPDHKLIARYAARFFWPAMVDGKLKVTTESPDDDHVDVEEYMHRYQPFIDLYKRVKNNERSDSDIGSKEIKVTVPAFPDIGYTDSAKTKAIAAMSLIGDDLNLSTHVGSVAQIRGQGMVINYWQPTGEHVQPYVGLALAGRASDNSADGRYGDVLMGYSEGVTHTSWDDNASNLREWRDAKQPIKKLMKTFKQYFEDNSTIQSRQTTEQLSTLEEGLSFSGQGRRTPNPDNEPRRSGPAVVTRPRIFRKDGGYGFSFRIRMNKKTMKTHVDVEILAGMESGTANAQDRIGIQITSAHGLECEDLLKKQERKVRIHLPRVSADYVYRIEGKTGDVDPELLSVTQAVLRASARPAGHQSSGGDGEEAVS